MSLFSPLHESRHGREEIDARLKVLEQKGFVKRLWEKDPTLWHTGPAHHQIIRNALGWLNLVEQEIEFLPRIKALVESVCADGFKNILLLGMGGSSLSAEVFRTIFGIVPGFPELHVLDSTIPAQIKRIENQIDLAKTLFIISSKSGRTIETISLYQYFFNQVQKIKGDQAGTHFIAITDPASPLSVLARKNQFRDLFLGAPDVGGRYSALSHFGIIPAALMGVNVERLLYRAKQMVVSCGADIPPAQNPGVLLGVTLSELAKLGRDKITFIASPAIQSFSTWLSQLIAESTGKEEVGIVPISDEPPGNPDVYGYDRIFVYIHYAGESETEPDKITALKNAGFPIIQAQISDFLNLGQAFFLWEMATAIAGALLRINPFDQPNVQESKDCTQLLLDEFKRKGELREDLPLVIEQGISIFCDDRNKNWLKAYKTVSEILADHLNQINLGDYVAFNVYLERSDVVHQALAAMRLAIRDKKKVATLLDYGPRFLHSTGQLHKGGANCGLFIQITSDDLEDVAIPGEIFTFGLLKSAQAEGDFKSLAQGRRRIIRIHLGSDVAAGLNCLQQVMDTILSQ
ncbi:MAG: transaldolase [Nitrospirota bacterium]